MDFKFAINPGKDGVSTTHLSNGTIFYSSNFKNINYQKK
jgi:hypothetical protein